jgi:Domain of unknown function (DUF4136)
LDRTYDLYRLSGIVKTNRSRQFPGLGEAGKNLSSTRLTKREKWVVGTVSFDNSPSIREKSILAATRATPLEAHFGSDKIRRHSRAAAETEASRRESMKPAIRTKMTKFGIGLALAMLACGGALAQDVTYNAMPGIDFSKYHTYKWVTIQGASYPNQIVDTQIKTSIDSQLASKGLTKTDTDKADLYIGYQGSIDQEKQWNAYGMGGGLRWGGNGHSSKFDD